MLAGAVMVSVEVPALEPTVTEDCEKLQVGMGAGPVTAHVSVTGPENPFSPAKVKTSPACAPVDMVKLVDVGAKEKSGGGVNVAVTDSAADMETVQTLGFVPVQAPLHPANTDPVAGIAVSETLAPGKYSDAQVPPELAQPMALSELVTVPLPLPASATLSCSPRTKFAVREVSAFMVNWHGPVPVQGPLQPANRELAPGVTVAATWVPLE